VQIVEKRSGVRRIVEHLGSAHDDLELALLLQAARDRLAAGQDELDLGLAPAPVGGVPAARVVSSSSRLLWQVLADAYARLGFDVLADEAFRALVLARLIEPTSKADTVRVLEEIGATAPHVNTLHAAMRRARDRDYRARLATACWAHSTRATGSGALILYDVTTLHFEVGDEDDLRKVGMSKEHRVDPQVQVGLLVDPGGFPLEIHMFEGNKAETTTLIPVLTAFQERHAVTDMVVVADAGMLSATNLDQLEDAGFSFIVGSRLVKAPYDLADHFRRHGNFFTDGQILESTRAMGTAKAARTRRVIYQWKFKRQKHDDRTINLMITKAEKVAAGTTAMRKTRFLKVTGATKELDQATIDRARQLAGLKGYVTNLSIQAMPGQAVIDAYHDLWQVERSFRMTKSDLRARPVFHHQREAIEAHLTIVFAALAVARHLQKATGVTIRKLVQTLRPLRSVVIAIGDHTIPADPTPGPEARTILDRLPPITPGH
jgi:transposase